MFALLLAIAVPDAAERWAGCVFKHADMLALSAYSAEDTAKGALLNCPEEEAQYKFDALGRLGDSSLVEQAATDMRRRLLDVATARVRYGRAAGLYTAAP